MSRRQKFCAIGLACIAAVSAVAAQSSSPKFNAAERRMKEYLVSPTPFRHQQAIADCRYAARPETLARVPDNARKLQGLLFRKFADQWINSGYGTGPSLQQFQELAVICQPFGADNRGLVALLRPAIVPVAWQNRAFRDYIQAGLPPSVDGKPVSDWLLTNWPAAPDRTIARFIFLSEVLPPADVSQVRAELSRSRLASSTAAEIGAYSLSLHELPPGLTRVTREYARDIQKQLGIRLYGLSPRNWTDAGSEIAVLIAESGILPQAFLAKAAEYFRRNPADRGPAAEVLGRVADMVLDPQVVYSIIQPQYDASWFTWLHTSPALLERIHSRNDLLQRSYGTLKDLLRDNFQILFPTTVLYYYDRDEFREAVFQDVLRPGARQTNAGAILNQALRRRYRAEHREILARDVLADADPLAPAWQGAAAPGRLDFAIQIYNGLLDSPVPSSLAAHLSSPLLDDIVSALLATMRRMPAPVDEIIRLVGTLASHLEQCRDYGGDTASSAPLQRLDREESGNLARAVEELNVPAPSMPALSSFVENVRMALRIRKLVERMLGRTPSWMPTVRQALAHRVFGLPEPSSQKTIYWSEAVTRRRADFLVRLDEPLRNVLLVPENHEEAHAFFAEVYLPLLRVHGFLKILQQGNPQGYPHYAWLRSGSEADRDLRLTEVFTALNIDRWVDADSAVIELTKLGLQGKNPWTVKPDQFFAAQWSANANFRIFHRLLTAIPPPPDEGSWQLSGIAAKAVGQLEMRNFPNGPNFSGPSGQADSRDSVWLYAEWAANVITASELQQYPLRRTGRPVPLQEFLRVSSSPEKPFQVLPEQPDLTRRVDGSVRLRFVWVLEENLGKENSGVFSAQQALQLADVVLLLPNHADNDAAGIRLRAHEVRQRTYLSLNHAMQESLDWHQRALILGEMMRLSVAQRESAPLDPPFLQVLDAFSATGVEAKEAASDIQAERIALIDLLKGKATDNLETARTFVDGEVAALLPPGWNYETIDVVAAQYGELLRRMTEERVRVFLQLSVRLRTILRALDHETSDSLHFPADMQRLERVLELINSHIWFTRTDLARMLEHGKPPAIFNPVPYHGPEAQALEWYPALVVLAWYDPGWFNDTLAAVKAYKGRRDQDFDLIYGRLFRQALQLNETVFAVTRVLAAQPNAESILASHRTITWRLLNLRLLTVTEASENAEPAHLPARAFAGLLANLEIASKDRPPSDQELWERLFGSLDYLLPEKHRRKQSVSVNLDQAVLLSEAWSRSDKVPAAVRAAAAGFAQGNDQRSQKILDGAATVSGVMNAFYEILRRTSASGEPQYVSFYTNALASNSRSFSPYFVKALAAPFFKTDVAGQRQSISGLLVGWKEYDRSPKGSTPLEMVYRQDFDRVLASLIRGKGLAAPEVDYIWRPVDELQKEQGVRLEKPDEFLRVAQWLLALQQQYPNSKLRALFGDRSFR